MSTTELVPDKDRRAAWLEDRRKHITGNDVAAIMGLSKFRTPLDVWLDKRYETMEQEVTEPMRWGLRLERGILRGYEEETGIALALADPYTLLTVPDCPLVGATLDAWHASGSPCPVDAKNVGRADQTEWGEPESDEIPMYYSLQLHVQIMCKATDLANLAALFWGQKFTRYIVHADAEIAATIKTEAEAWWKRHIINGECPTIDGSKSAAEYLSRKFASHTEVMLASDDEIARIAVSLREVRKALAEQELIEAAYVNQLKERIGGAAGIVGDWGKITWKRTKDGSKTDWEALAKYLKASPQQIAAYTDSKPGSRRFLAKFKDGE